MSSSASSSPSSHEHLPTSTLEALIGITIVLVCVNARVVFKKKKYSWSQKSLCLQCAGESKPGHRVAATSFGVAARGKWQPHHVSIFLCTKASTFTRHMYSLVLGGYAELTVHVHVYPATCACVRACAIY